MVEMERRSISWEDVPEAELTVEKRADGRPVIRGYAIVYNRLSQDLGGFRERIMPGAFDKVLGRQRGRQDLVSYFNHDPNMLLGRESSGTLEVFCDEKGVGYTVTPPLARADVIELVSRRDVKGSSFAFTVASGGEAFSNRRYQVAWTAKCAGSYSARTMTITSDVATIAARAA